MTLVQREVMMWFKDVWTERSIRPFDVYVLAGFSGCFPQSQEVKSARTGNSEESAGATADAGLSLSVRNLRLLDFINTSMLLLWVRRESSIRDSGVLDRHTRWLEWNPILTAGCQPDWDLPEEVASRSGVLLKAMAVFTLAQRNWARTRSSFGLTYWRCRCENSLDTSVLLGLIRHNIT